MDLSMDIHIHGKPGGRGVMLPRAPGRKQILVHFELEKTNLLMTNLILFVIFIAHIYSQIYKASFEIFFLIRRGPKLLSPPPLTPPSPSGYANWWQWMSHSAPQ